jgi:hypothetical protein
MQPINGLDLKSTAEKSIYIYEKPLPIESAKSAKGLEVAFYKLVCSFARSAGFNLPLLFFHFSIYKT